MLRVGIGIGLGLALGLGIGVGIGDDFNGVKRSGLGRSLVLRKCWNMPG